MPTGRKPINCWLSLPCAWPTRRWSPQPAAPCLALALLAFSLLCAVGYSRYLARPIVRISSIAGRMAELDFQWKCGETRRDEIGALGRSLDEMAERLSAALAELEEANAALRGDMERARELERQRLAFFSAASHELKTPVTILKGQLSGMLDGVGCTGTGRSIWPAPSRWRGGWRRWWGSCWPCPAWSRTAPPAGRRWSCPP